jgi:serine protease Do
MPQLSTLPARSDVITSIDGEPLKDAHELAKRIERMAPGTAAQLRLLRNGNERPVTVTLGKLPDWLSFRLLTVFDAH